MRIVGGEARGRKLFAPEGETTRPTADRVRESLFSILMGSVRGARVIDLFAGSGALSLEAISRGAASAVLIDMDRKAQQAIARNIDIVGAKNRVKLIKSDWRGALSSLHEPFDIVFLDPPYAMLQSYSEAAGALRDRELLAEGAILVMEHRSKDALSLPDGFEIYDERRYGETMIAFVREVDI